ncbi:FixH family protein [Roseitalea porphyridii]|uniref:Cytochrome oxidase n=1 Tax=Roseitalea porphyridii TaxID=1852022 RepID=A0A4V1A437_9HYPH|nr:FixH family protein [Roseitalea porphyridii]QBK31258.1 cytochrome oxidase [Roseitalea porphyridii]
MLQRIFAPERFTGWHFLAIMLGWFGIVIGVNLFMAWNATSSWTGLVVKNSYVASQQFNEVTAEKRRQLAMGWKATPAYEAGTLTLDMRDAARAPIADAIITAKLGRPSYEADDHMVQFAETAPGIYEGRTDLTAGVWNADVTVTGAGGDVWTRTLRFSVR